ncbi:Mov34/MPN/PAD-1 family protein [Halorussus salilacus]|uniref:Mov34/MPN/PAD-1 family protein n=1 Tax=Halorussus salilacus TaxID=2953750 RepID=UPI00209DD055|nr:Mov34/MPN/PAD-1 family protein [Halorussus salilacus]USZ69230.1 Mov34/MPN/PAD-1 family protein [Halorussus salilacus]
MFDRFFGGSDDSEESDSAQNEQQGIEVHTNAGAWGTDVNVTTGDPSGILDDDSWFETHTFEVDFDDESSTSAGPSRSTATPPTGTGRTVRPETPPEDSPLDPSAPRGTFSFPASKPFMQALETRGKNGAHERVETVYVLTGQSYTTPTELFGLDDPEYYASATRRSVTTKEGKIARRVAASYPAGETPNVVARFHTHPGGSTVPSDTDVQSAEKIERCYEQAFGTDDFEFFHGIHAYVDQSGTPSVEDRHDPTALNGGVSWRGEQYRHELALFGPRFRNSRSVVIADGS